MCLRETLRSVEVVTRYAAVQNRLGVDGKLDALDDSAESFERKMPIKRLADGAVFCLPALTRVRR